MRIFLTIQEFEPEYFQDQENYRLKNTVSRNPKMELE